MAAQTQDPEAILKSKLGRLEDECGKLGSALLFADEIDRVSRREARLDEMAGSLAKIRARGYRFAVGLEGLLESATAAASNAMNGARTESEAVMDLLRPRVDRAQRALSQLATYSRLSGREAEVERLEGELHSIDEAMDEARQRIEAVIRPFCAPFDEVEKKLRALHTTLDRFDSRSFDMTPEESPFAAFPATWKDSTSGEELEGFLFLSDHRLRFEQREEKVTKRKFLVFAAEKETIQKCWLDEPIGHLESSTDETEGWLLKDQLLILRWAGAAKAPSQTTFELDGARAKEVDELVEAVLSGEIERDRWISDGEPAVAAPLDWPEECADCGAEMEPPVKGQTRIRCPYCGHVYQLK